MWNDVVDLNDFYQTPLGERARQMIRLRLRAMWPDLADMTLLGLGYATPYLRQFSGEAGRVIAAMPAQQGIIPWPVEGANRAMLVDETALPLADESVDRALIVHGVECAEQLRDMLRELWRVMASSGRIAFVVPNRSSLWAQIERTPFGQGHPYSQAQIHRLLRGCMFTPLGTLRALYMPPMRLRPMLRMAGAWERAGSRLFPRLGGVMVIEAAKQLYGANAVPVRRRRPVVVPMPQPARNAHAAQMLQDANEERPVR
ncbi:MAG: methyltransferase domain-containing protein [Dongiaceae bacterium]